MIEVRMTVFIALNRQHFSYVLPNSGPIPESISPHVAKTLLKAQAHRDGFLNDRLIKTRLMPLMPQGMYPLGDCTSLAVTFLLGQIFSAVSSTSPLHLIVLSRHWKLSNGKPLN